MNNIIISEFDITRISKLAIQYAPSVFSGNIEDKR